MLSKVYNDLAYISFNEYTYNKRYHLKNVLSYCPERFFSLRI